LYKCDVIKATRFIISLLYIYNMSKLGDVKLTDTQLGDNRIVNDFKTVKTQYKREDKFDDDMMFHPSDGKALVKDREDFAVLPCRVETIDIGRKELENATATLDRDQQRATVADRRDERMFYVNRANLKYKNPSKCFKKRPLIPAVSFIPSATILNEQVGVNLTDPTNVYDLLTDGPEKTPDEGVCNSLTENRNYASQKMKIDRLLDTRQKALKQVKLTMRKIYPPQPYIVSVKKMRAQQYKEPDKEKISEKLVRSAGDIAVRQAERKELRSPEQIEEARLRRGDLMPVSRGRGLI